MSDICIVGFGALGTLYGYLLERSGRACVTAVCRSNYDVMKAQGVNIRSVKFGSVDAWKPTRAVKTIEEAADRQYEFIICATKYLPDVVPTSQLLGPLLERTSTFVLVQNGIGVESDLLQAAPKATIISGCAWVDATLREGGTVLRHGRLERLVLGVHFSQDPGIEIDQILQDVSQARLDLVVELLKAGGGDACPTPHINAQRWRKNLWNIGYSVLCTLTRTNCVNLLSNKWEPTTGSVARGFMEEAVAIGRATGLTPTLLPDSAIGEAEHIAYNEYAETYAPREAATFAPVPYKPSMLVDLEGGRPIEVEGIVGCVVKRGRELGVHAPRLETACAALSLIQESLVQDYRARIIPETICTVQESDPKDQH